MDYCIVKKFQQHIRQGEVRTGSSLSICGTEKVSLSPGSWQSGSCSGFKKWVPGIIQSLCSEPNSYIVSTNCGRLFRRNRQAINLDKSLVQLRRTQQKKGIPSIELSLPAVSIDQPMRRSINFIEE
jgi:hypothetical protein